MIFFGRLFPQKATPPERKNAGVYNPCTPEFYRAAAHQILHSRMSARKIPDSGLRANTAITYLPGTCLPRTPIRPALKFHWSE